MEHFPEFMRKAANRIKSSSQYTRDIEGYVYDGVDGSQMAFWTCYQDRESNAHAHEYDEYLVCVQGEYSVILPEKTVILKPGDELHIPAGLRHGGRCCAGTRTIHAFGGKRAEREECEETAPKQRNCKT
ncbi:MAG: cupin domain-containing protein [candidate division FCPU426 bacterium]